MVGDVRDRECCRENMRDVRDKEEYYRRTSREMKETEEYYKRTWKEMKETEKNIVGTTWRETERQR